jgi:hypothetical protein
MILEQSYEGSEQLKKHLGGKLLQVFTDVQTAAAKQ